jgi:predicted DsbA family dithiol-disulfide isomerase
MAKQVKVYSTPACPWCIITRQFMDGNKISYQSLDEAWLRQQPNLPKQGASVPLYLTRLEE